MGADQWFVRWSPSGRAIAAGSTRVSIVELTGAEVEVGPGTTPVWLDEGTVLYTRQPDGALVRWPDGAVLHPQGFNVLSACAGRWAGWRAAEDILVRSWAEALPGARMPQVGRTSFACVVPAGNAWRLLRDGEGLHQAALRDLRMSPDGVLCWSQHVGGAWETWGARPGQGPERLHLASGQELWPVPLDGPEGPWVLSHTDHALLLRPWGRDTGYLVHVGTTDFPDGAWTPAGWRVAWSDRGAGTMRRIPHDTPRVALRDVLVPTPAPPAPPELPKEPEPVSIPNYLWAIDEVRKRYPAAWAVAHNKQANGADFVILLARHLNTSTDARVGVNGKRGNPNDLSQDVLAFKGIGTAVDVVNGGAMEIVDVIKDAGLASATPAWQVAPGGPGDKGAWVNPFSVQTTIDYDAAPPAPIPDPRPPYQPPPTVTCKALSADEVRGVVRAEMSADREHIASALTALADLVQGIRYDLEAAAKRREELADLTAQRIATTTAARPVTVSGRVSITGTTTLRGTVGEPQR